ncbi:DUF4431 domain-containing protein [Croceibacterium xixiisoli]|nr:DUF4431 domain-containing protein [Croceibacterium xixiisoli]
MRCALGMIIALLIPAAVPAMAEQAGTTSTGRCVNAARADAIVTLAGRLERKEFPANADLNQSATHAFILHLPRMICFEDGEFADGSERFDRVHVIATTPQIAAQFTRAVGQTITVAGPAMGAHTAHHRAPMVLRVERVTQTEK